MTVRIPVSLVSPITSRVAAGIVEPIPTCPVELIATLIDPAVWNDKTSSSFPALASAVTKVSPSTSLTPPREPH